MLNKMSLLLAAASVALSAGAALAAHDNFGGDNSRRHNDRGTGVVLDFGTIAFGYNDGYWDTGHRWHNWRNQNDYQNYSTHGRNFHGWKHNRDHDNGWRNR
jgi:hypothetical protein